MQLTKSQKRLLRSIIIVSACLASVIALQIHLSERAKTMRLQSE